MRRLDPWLAVGIVLLFALLVASLYGDRLAPHEPYFSVLVGPGGETRPLSPGAPFPLGSDLAGRDLWSLVLHGTRITLAVVVIAGLARLALGFALAVLALRSRSARASIDVIADIASAVPSTIVAVLVVLALASRGAGIAVFVGALLVTGWAGPYRVLRLELTRLRVAPFTEGAHALGVDQGALVWRHFVPHLAPVIALTVSQQVTAALVALAELGVLAVFVTPARTLNLEESLPLVRFTDVVNVTVTEQPEWGSMLAMARGIENLYVTRWVFLVPGVAIAFAAISFALAGIGIARQYRRRNIAEELRSRGALVLFAFALLVVAPAIVLPPRHADAVGLAAATRAHGPSGMSFVPELLDRSGLAPVGNDYALERTSTVVRQTGPATVTIRSASGQVALVEGWAAEADFVPVLFKGSGGGVVDAPVVFAGWGVSPADFPALPPSSVFSARDLGTEIAGWADDYRDLDVRGKVVLVLKLGALGTSTPLMVTGPDFETTVANAAKRGAAAVLYVDPGRAADEAGRSRGVPNPYRRLMDIAPIESPAGVPALVVDTRVAERLLAGTGLDVRALLDSAGSARSSDPRFPNVPGLRTSDPFFRTPRAQPLDAVARIDLPVDRLRLTSRSLVAATPARPDGRALLLWAPIPSLLDGDSGAASVITTLLETVADRRLPDGLVVVLFDTGGDPIPDARAIASTIGPRRYDLVLAIDSLRGSRLRFVTLHGELQLLLDDYARQAGAAALPTRATQDARWVTGLEAFVKERTAVVLATGPSGDEAAGEAAAFLAYLLGRYADGSEELRR